jgi:excisionase family DNA binding protein
MAENSEFTKPLLVSIDRAAGMLSLSRHTIRAYERKGLIKATRIGTRVLIPAAEVERLAREGTDDSPNRPEC